MVSLETVSNVLFACFLVLLVVSSVLTSLRKRIKESIRKSVLTTLWVVTAVVFVASGLTAPTNSR